ncbi:MAG: ABC transporter ATP-binding protein [Deltaproteobacteria bacterium]|nr:ABC transporter ATP-binding protein [Deltaproteobacteria bacterium]MCL5278188.1 ABC transporter ATP-binding protein [Deltaproteobacteria bacterium]
MNNSVPLLKILDMHKSFYDRKRRIDVLKGVNLDVQGGETVSITGVSGSGKTTLLQIIGSLDRPTSGDVLFKDESIFGRSADALSSFRNANIGFVFQFHHLLMEFDLVENVMFPAIISGVPGRQAQTRALDLLKDVGLSDKVSNKPSELSGGEQQKVAVARALVMSPPIVLADEPTGNLDSHSGEAIMGLLLKFNRALGITVMIVTHNESFAKMMSKRYRIHDGLLFENMG